MNSFVLATPLLILFISFGNKAIGSILAVSENYFSSMRSLLKYTAYVITYGLSGACISIRSPTFILRKKRNQNNRRYYPYFSMEIKQWTFLSILS